MSNSEDFIAACSEVAHDGTRNARAASLIAMLASDGPLPDDAVRAAMAMLYESCGQHEVSSAWEAMLEHPSRSKLFAVAVLKAWNSVRCVPQWPTAKVESVAHALWTAAHRLAA